MFDDPTNPGQTRRLDAPLALCLLVLGVVCSSAELSLAHD